MAMSTTRKVVLMITGIVLGLVLIGFVGVAILVSALRGEQPSIRDNSVLDAASLRAAAGLRPGQSAESHLRRRRRSLSAAC